MEFANNPAFTPAFTSEVHRCTFYMPSDLANGYHMSRFVAASAQDIYSGAGATKEVLQKIASDVVAMCNDTKKQMDTLRTDVATLMNNLLYRLKYPIDEDCAIRMGALFCFMPGENPDAVHDFWTQKKVAMAKGDYERGIEPDPDLYAFFLRQGLQSSPSYARLLDTLTATTMDQRREALRGLVPPSLSKT
jgi:hypothetical protein